MTTSCFFCFKNCVFVDDSRRKGCFNCKLNCQLIHMAGNVFLLHQEIHKKPEHKICKTEKKKKKAKKDKINEYVYLSKMFGYR